MNIQSYDFSEAVQRVTSLQQCLNQRRRGICGSRTLEQTYRSYRMKLMFDKPGIAEEDREIIQKMDPRKIDWAAAFEWWRSTED